MTTALLPKVSRLTSWYGSIVSWLASMSRSWSESTAIQVAARKRELPPISSLQARATTNIQFVCRRTVAGTTVLFIIITRHSNLALTQGVKVEDQPQLWIWSARTSLGCGSGRRLVLTKVTCKSNSPSPKEDQSMSNGDGWTVEVICNAPPSTSM
jgi:hypothetical protein